MQLSVIIPAHNPHSGRLGRTLAGLVAQTLPADQFEVVLVDNASSPPLALPPAAAALRHFRLVTESVPGLTPARLRGFAESQAELFVIVDDDNVLAPDYLANVARHFARDSLLGALGGRVAPEFETPPPGWVRPFYGLLALRDPGTAPLRADWRSAGERHYPNCAPVGAGLALRRSLAAGYAAALAQDPLRRALDRTGGQLVSGGDNDLVMHVLEAGFRVGYEPDLSLTHLIPSRRLERSYLGALNRAIARSWIRVLALHGIRPWPDIAPRTVWLRQSRAWLRAQAWRSDGAWVTWQGWCGTFEGQADLSRLPAGKSMPSSRPSTP